MSSPWQQLKSPLNQIVSEAQWVAHALLVGVLLILLIQDLGIFRFNLIPGGFTTWIYAAGFAYLIRR